MITEPLTIVRTLPHSAFDDGRPATQLIYRFPNGFGASVVNSKYSHGNELAVLHFTGPRWDDSTIVYDTGVTADVIGHLDAAELERVLEQIAALRRSPAWLRSIAHFLGL